MVGVNQVIMLSLNMVIIASMIGAGGLGHDVLAALRRLDFGAGLEAALGITLLAIALDRLSQAFARKPPPAHGRVEPSFVRRHPHLVIALALLLGGWALAAIWPRCAHLSRRLQVTTAARSTPAWSGSTSTCSMPSRRSSPGPDQHHGAAKRLLLGLPWPAVVAAVALAGWQLGGARLARRPRRSRCSSR